MISLPGDIESFVLVDLDHLDEYMEVLDSVDHPLDSSAHFDSNHFEHQK